MNLIGQIVQHKTLGEGTVVACDGKYLTVRFGSGDKTFVYPDAFRAYLTVSDPALAEQIRQALAQSDAERERKEARRREEARCLTRGVVMPGNKYPQLSPSDPYREQDGDRD